MWTSWLSQRFWGEIPKHAKCALVAAQKQSTPVSSEREEPIERTCIYCLGQGRVMDPEICCKACGGSKTVNYRSIRQIKIKKRMDYGQRIIIRGAGNEQPGRSHGNIILTVARLKISKYCTRNEARPSNISSFNYKYFTVISANNRSYRLRFFVLIRMLISMIYTLKLIVLLGIILGNYDWIDIHWSCFDFNICVFTYNKEHFLKY